MNALDRTMAAAAKLDDDDFLRLHRFVCSRAAKIYAPRYAMIQQQNHRAAMAMRDTRFVKGLSPLENVKRAHSLAK